MQGIVERKSTMAMLSNTLIRAEESGHISLAATDLDVTLVGRCAASVESMGALTVNARALYDVVRSLPPGELALSVQENNYVEIRHGSIEFRMVGMAPEEFPSLPESGDFPGCEIGKRQLFSMIDAVIFSVSNDDTRPNLNGVLLKPSDDEKLIMVSTDGHRLSKIVRVVDADLSMLPTDGAIIPRKGLSELKKVMDDPSDTVFFGVLESQAVFRSENEYLFIRLIDGVFPHFNRVLPKKNLNVARIDRDCMITSLRRVSIFAQSKTMGVRIGLDPDGVMSISSSSSELGNAHEELKVDYEGTKLEIGFNARYLLDCISSIQDKEIRFEMNDDLSPGIIRTEEDEESFYVVMPMRL